MATVITIARHTAFGKQFISLSPSLFDDNNLRFSETEAHAELQAPRWLGRYCLAKKQIDPTFCRLYKKDPRSSFAPITFALRALARNMIGHECSCRLTG